MKRVLLVRHDKIGDFVLTWPAFYLMRTAFPDARIAVFVAPVVASLAEACPYIDDVIIDSRKDQEAIADFVERKFDAAIALHSPWRICRIFRKAKIPYTLGPKHKWYQYLYRDRASAKYEFGEPCWRGNCLIVEHFIRRQAREVPGMPPRLWDNASERVRWRSFYGQQGDEKLIFVHAGTGGSSGTLSSDGFVHLLTTVHATTQVLFKVILTWSGEEQPLAADIQRRLSKNGVRAELAQPLEDLADFARSLVAADMFVAGSTGPIHLAGLHDVPTVGFYAGRRSRPDLKWATMTHEDKRLSFTPPIGRRTGRDMSLVDLDNAGAKIGRFLDRHYLN